MQTPDRIFSRKKKFKIVPCLSADASGLVLNHEARDKVLSVGISVGWQIAERGLPHWVNGIPWRSRVAVHINRRCEIRILLQTVARSYGQSDTRIIDAQEPVSTHWRV